MNILFYQHQYPAFGGIETVTTLLARQFAVDGHLVAIVSIRAKSGTKLLDELPSTVAVHHLPEDVYDSERNREALLAILNNFTPDVVMFQDSYAPIENTLFSALERYGRGPVLKVVVEHSMPKVEVPCGELSLSLGPIKFARRLLGQILYPARYWKRFAYERRRRRALYAVADKYVFLSPRYIPVSNRIAGMDGGEKLTALPNPIRPLTLEPNLSDKRKEILFCGSLISGKGVSRLIDIWAELESSHTGWVFTIVGDGEERRNLEGQVARLGLKNVRFEGFRTDTEAYCHRASIFVMASSFEGWPMVLGEAMQQGCVPIAYDSFAALFDIVEDGKSGRIIKYKDSAAFSDALDELMTNADKLVRLQRGAIEKANEYDLETIARRWCALVNGGVR